ncbi:MAG: hypothetical protein ACI4U2_01710 [Christensenellaceae bacterium]
MQFFSDHPCFVTLGSVPFGPVDRSPRPIDAEWGDGLYVQVLSEGGSCAFPLSVSLLSDPPDCVSVFDGEEVVFLLLHPPLSSSLKVYSQAESDDKRILATLFSQGRLTLSIESDSLVNVPLSADLVDASLTIDAGIVLLEGKSALAAYDLSGKELFFTYAAERKTSDCLGRSVDCRIEGERLIYTLSDDPLLDARGNPLDETMLPFALLENVRLGAPFSELLDDSLSAQKLPAFLGTYERVIPLHDKPVLVRRRKRNLFTLHPVSVELKDGKIYNVKL